MFAVLSATALLSPAFAQQPSEPLHTAPDGRALTLTFSDDFQTFRPWNGTSGVWRTTFGDGTQLGLDRRSLPSNAELEIYVDRYLADDEGPIGLDPFIIHDDHLDIVARPTPVALVPRLRNYPYTSGLISSQPSFSQLHGYFEMRAKIPGGKGMWPAFWLIPEDQSGPQEIDVMESVGDPSHIYATAHSSLRPAVEIAGHVTPDAFHTYAVSWDEAHLIFYVDGKEIGEQATPADFTKPMCLIANLAIGGNWPGVPDATTRFPATMSIDYIRAYRFSHE
jgi:hypothetical protein